MFNLAVIKHLENTQSLNKQATIIIISSNFDTSNNHDLGMSEDQRIVFMELMADSLRVSNRPNLFNWLQGNFQYLLNHEIMIFGVKLENDDDYSFEYSASTRYFKDHHFNESVKKTDGVINQAIKRWDKMRLPLFYCNTLAAADYNNFSVQSIDEDIMQSTELKNFVVHGFGDNHSKVSTLVVFARISGQLNTIQAQFWS